MVMAVSLRNILLLALCSGATLVVGTQPDKERQHRDVETFQQLLDAVPHEALHEALHDALPNYKHGVFREDREALEQVHADDAATATSLIVKGLLKRQATPSNGTTTSSTTSTSSTPLSTTTTSSTTSTQTTSSTTPIVAPVSTSSSSTTTTSSTFSTPSTSSTSTSTSFAPTSSSSTTSSSTSSSTSSTSSSFSISSTSTTTSTTAAPSTATIIRTSTLPNGQRSTVTAVTVVGGPAQSEGPTPSGNAAVAPATPSPSSPGLQTNAAAGPVARPARGMLKAVCGGLVAMAVGVIGLA